MERRRALVVAGTMTATLAMAGTAMAVNMGLLSSDSDPVGDLTATEIQPAAQRRPAQREPRVRVVVEDIPIATGGGSSSGSVESSDSPAPAPAPAPHVDDDSYDDDSYDDDSYDDDSYDDHDDEDTDDSVDEPDEPDEPDDDD